MASNATACTEFVRTIFGNPLLSLLVSVHFLAGIAIVVFMYRYLRRVHFTHWWDLSEKRLNGPLEWEAVRQLMQTDPTSHSEALRLCSIVEITKEFVVIVLIINIWICGLRLIWRYQAHIIAQHQFTSASLVIGGVGAFMAFAGVLYTSRVNVRSANRQAWINELRDTLSRLLHYLPDETDDERHIKEAQDLGKELRAKVELLLNPSERDHRALMVLVRYLYRFPSVLTVDAETRRNLGLDIDGAELRNQDRFKERKSELIRLINAVLKREWEQVKHIQ